MVLAGNFHANMQLGIMVLHKMVRSLVKLTFSGSWAERVSEERWFFEGFRREQKKENVEKLWRDTWRQYDYVFHTSNPGKLLFPAIHLAYLLNGLLHGI